MFSKRWLSSEGESCYLVHLPVMAQAAVVPVQGPCPGWVALPWRRMWLSVGSCRSHGQAICRSTLVVPAGSFISGVFY